MLFLGLRQLVDVRLLLLEIRLLLEVMILLHLELLLEVMLILLSVSIVGCVCTLLHFWATISRS